MKRFFIFLAICLTTLSGCTKDNGNDNENENANPYVGTKWSKSSSAFNYTVVKILDFTSDTEVQYYSADANGNYTGDLVKGTYTFVGNEVTFSGLIHQDLTFKDLYIKAVVSGNMLTLYEQRVYNNGNVSDFDSILMKLDK